MKVRLLEDYVSIPAGTVLREVTPYKNHAWYGLYTSMEGSHYVYVPKKICKVIEENK